MNWPWQQAPYLQLGDEWHGRFPGETGPCFSKWLAIGSSSLLACWEQNRYGSVLCMTPEYRANSMFDWHPAKECPYV